MQPASGNESRLRAAIARQRYPFRFTRHLREAPAFPARCGLVYQFARARDEVPPDVAIAVERGAAKQHHARRGASRDVHRSVGWQDGEMMRVQGKAFDVDLPCNGIDAALFVLERQLQA